MVDEKMEAASSRGGECSCEVMSLGVTLRPGLVHDLTNEEHRRICIGINTLTVFWNDPFLPLELRKREPWNTPRHEASRRRWPII